LESPSPPNPLSQPWERGRKCLSQVSETTVSRSTISHLDRAGWAMPTHRAFQDLLVAFDTEVHINR
ncbi:hypothetical protein PN462_17020, partial [Spirulina sp. CS-785/01]|uniref:hypothetical protein n=1 Tax=Spirulina sp. CS-785/01 TaxID=3021716 RepID=UPI00232D9017